MLTLFHDYTFPASAVAVARVTRLRADDLPCRIIGTEVIGVDTVLPVTVDVLAELAAVADEAEAEGLLLRRPRQLPPTAAAHLVEEVARAHGLGGAWRARCYRAFWTDRVDISDGRVLRGLAADIGLPADEVERTLGDRVALLTIRRRFAAHRRDGIGGVPTISYDRTLIPGLLSVADLRALAALGPETS